VPTVSVTETQPAGTTYQTWMLSQLDALGAALAKGGADNAGNVGAAPGGVKGKSQ
jgi:zinc/manganese transport system substrate-binding protein